MGPLALLDVALFNLRGGGFENLSVPLLPKTDHQQQFPDRIGLGLFVRPSRCGIADW